MFFSGPSLDLDDSDPGIEELIEDFFPEKIGRYNYDIRNKAIRCYHNMILEKDSPTSFSTVRSTVRSSSKPETMSIENLMVYAKDNHLKWSERETPITEKTQEMIISGRAYRYTIKNTYYLFDAPNKCFYKMYKFNSRNIVSILSIIREIVLHNYAIFLNSKCTQPQSKKKSLRTNSRRMSISLTRRKVKQFQKIPFVNKIKIPKLQNYFYNNAEENTEIILKYEMLHIVFPTSNVTIDLKAAIISDWEFFHTKIVELLTCFGSNGLYHNDSHIDNLCFVRISNQTYGLAIIDFGKATLSEPVHSSLMGYIKPQKDSTKRDKKQHFLNWMNRVATSDTKWDDNTRYGGFNQKSA